MREDYSFYDYYYENIVQPFERVSNTDFAWQQIEKGEKIDTLLKEYKDIHCSELVSKILKDFNKFEEQQALDYLLLLCGYDSSNYTSIIYAGPEVGAKFLQKLDIYELWKSKPEGIGHLICAIICTFPKPVEIVKPFLECKEADLRYFSHFFNRVLLNENTYVQENCRLYASLEYRKNEIDEAQFNALFILFLKYNIVPQYSYQQENFFNETVFKLINSENIRYLKPFLSKAEKYKNLVINKFNETEDAEVKFCLAEIFKNSYSEQKDSNWINQRDLSSALASASMSSYYFRELTHFVKSILEQQFLPSVLIILVTQYLIETEDFLEEILLKFIKRDNQKSISNCDYYEMMLPQKGDTGLCGAYAAANALIPLIFHNKDSKLFEELLTTSMKNSNGLRQKLVDFQLGKDAKTGEFKVEATTADFTPGQMRQLFKEKNLPPFSGLIPQMKKLNKTSAVSMVPMHYESEVKIGTCDPLIMLKLARNLIKLSARISNKELIAHPFLVFWSNIHWLCLNLLVKDNRVIWLICESESRSHEFLVSFCQKISSLLFDRVKLTSCIDKILSDAYQDTFLKQKEVKPNEEVFIQMKSLLKTWLVIGKDKLLNYTFKEKDQLGMQQVNTCLQQNQSYDSSRMKQCQQLNVLTQALASSIFTTQPKSALTVTSGANVTVRL